MVGWLMLNPSTADEEDNDPTVERCEVRARQWGYDGVMVANIFALRSTNPLVLKSFVGDPIGGLENDAYILNMARECFPVICAWGTHGTLFGRGAEVLKMLRENKVDPWALRANKDGSPEHPLYIGYDVMPRPLEELCRLNAK